MLSSFWISASFPVATEIFDVMRKEWVKTYKSCQFQVDHVHIKFNSSSPVLYLSHVFLLCQESITLIVAAIGFGFSCSFTS